ncbi:MAG: SPFH domain-containing protein, partial [Candidatus Poseidoniales archaeon]
MQPEPVQITSAHKLPNDEIMFKDVSISTLNGFLGLAIQWIALPILILSMFVTYGLGPLVVIGIIVQIILIIVWFLMFNSYLIINPNEGAAIQFFGEYKGTVDKQGFHFFFNPLYEKQKISLRIRNFESAKLKVNDVNANPIEIAAVVVWKVVDTAEALFEVDNYQNYVQIQSEAALRAMATKYPYDIIEDKDVGGIALSSHQEVIAQELQISVEARLKRAGIQVLEAR